MRIARDSPADARAHTIIRVGAAKVFPAGAGATVAMQRSLTTVLARVVKVFTGADGASDTG